MPKIVFSRTLQEPLGCLEVMLFPAITGKAGYAALFKDGPEFDLELVESTVFDGRTQKLVYVPHLHEGIPAGVGPQRRDG
jgi:hypothetical protein